LHDTDGSTSSHPGASPRGTGRRRPGGSAAALEAMIRPCALVSAAGRSRAVSAGRTRRSRLATSTSAPATPKPGTGTEGVIAYRFVQASSPYGPAMHGSVDANHSVVV